MSPDREILTINNENYEVGDLSLFPISLDDDVSLYDTSNNAIAVLSGLINTKSEFISVNDNGFFPDQGILRINDEQIYYGKKEDGVFLDLIRGFNFTGPMIHRAGSVVLGCVSSLHHNSVRDSIIKCEQKTGLITDIPDINGTLTSRVKFLDIKWFTPTSRFFGFPRKGRAPLTVNFRNWSLGEPYIDSNISWDFGDVNDSDTVNISKKHTFHIYKKPGIYTVTLSVSAPDGRSSYLSKNAYIEVYDDDSVVDLSAYARIKDPIRDPNDPDNSSEPLRINQFGRPMYNSEVPFEVQFVDQTLGLVQSRRWNFGDGTIVDVKNKCEHTIYHTYTSNGVFWPEIQVLDQNDTLRSYAFRQPVIVGNNNSVTKTEMLLGMPEINNNLATLPTLNNRYTFKNNEEKLDESLIV